jgi:hypothetical protein
VNARIPVGNVGGDQTLAQVAAILNAEQQDP